MKTTLLFTLMLFLSPQMGFSQNDIDDCWCDTSYHALEPETTWSDSINWKQIKCYYTQKRSRRNPKSVLNYRGGLRHGESLTYYPKKYWINVRQRGYQRATPRRYHKFKDFYHREGKSLFGKSEIGNYVNGKMHGVWRTMDTNQRITSTSAWDTGVLNSSDGKCKGLSDISKGAHYEAFDSIGVLVTNLEDGLHKFLYEERTIISFEIADNQLNGEVRFYKKNKKMILYSIHQFKNNCLTDSSITFDINGDTTRIEFNFQQGVPYSIVSYTPSSRGTSHYRDPQYFYELNSDYRNGLIIVRRE